MRCGTICDRVRAKGTLEIRRELRYATVRFGCGAVRYGAVRYGAVLYVTVYVQRDRTAKFRFSV